MSQGLLQGAGATRSLPASPPDTLLGTQIAQLTGNDVDSGPALSYTLALDGEAVGTFSVLRYGGHVALTAPLDYERRSRYTLALRASDTRHETEANLTVLVEDVNDNAPAFSQGFYQVPCPRAERGGRCRKHPGAAPARLAQPGEAQSGRIGESPNPLGWKRPMKVISSNPTLQGASFIR